MLDLEHDQVVSLLLERRLRGGYGLLLRIHAGRGEGRSRRSAADTEQIAWWNSALKITGAVSTARAAGYSRPRRPASDSGRSVGDEAFHESALRKPGRSSWLRMK